MLSAAIAFALVPSLTMLLTPLMRKKNPSSTLEKVSAVGLLLSIAYMSYSELSGTGGISNISLTDRVFGVSLALSTSVGIVLNSFVTKKVVELGFKATEIMAFRFYGVVVATLAILLIRGTPVVGVDAHWFGFIAILSILLVVVPIYLVQKGIEKSEPITVSLLWSLTPAVTLTFQTIEGRLHPTLESVLGTTLCCFFAFLGAWAGSQKKIPAA